MVNATPRPLYPRERPGTHCIGIWLGPRAGLDGCGKSCPHRDSIPGPSSPLRVAIPTELSRPTTKGCNLPNSHVKHRRRTSKQGLPQRGSRTACSSRWTRSLRHSAVLLPYVTLDAPCLSCLLKLGSRSASSWPPLTYIALFFAVQTSCAPSRTNYVREKNTAFPAPPIDTKLTK